MNRLPNLVYVFADDMGYGDVSCLNPYGKLHTKFIDRLAQRGMIFTDAHSSSAVCSPSRYSLLTGRYNWRSRLKRGVIGGYSLPLIEPERLTIPELLKRRDYDTACIGKWHLGLGWDRDMSIPEPERYLEPEGVNYKGRITGGPCDLGFDYFYGIAASLDMPPYVYIQNDHVEELPDHVTSNTGQQMWRPGPTAPHFVHSDVLPHLTQKALEYIDHHGGGEKPFFLYFPLPAPHTPILPVGDFIGRSGTNCYGDFVLMCDDTVGQLYNKLQDKGILENTIFIFASDNGCSPAARFDELKECGHNPSYHFRGHKADIYEGGHRIPLIVSWPEKIKANSTSDQTVCLCDLMATMAEITDYSLPSEAAVDSISNLDIWIGKQDKPLREALVHHSINGSFSIRIGRWKLELCPGSGGWSWPKPGEETADMPEYQLFDLEDDISETKNVYLEHKDIAESMRRILVDYIRRGRSTEGPVQTNFDPDFFTTYKWFY